MPEPFQLHRDPFGRLALTDAHGVQHLGVNPIRGFPISAAEYGVSICDQEGRELVWIRRLSELPGELRNLLEHELSQREFMPVLESIDKISTNNEPCEWQVQTDRGPTAFVLKSDEDVRRLDGARAIVTDANGIAYLIADLNRLNAVSQRYLERYL